MNVMGDTQIIEVDNFNKACTPLFLRNEQEPTGRKGSSEISALPFERTPSHMIFNGGD